MNARYGKTKTDFKTTSANSKSMVYTAITACENIPGASFNLASVSTNSSEAAAAQVSEQAAQAHPGSQVLIWVTSPY